MLRFSSANWLPGETKIIRYSPASDPALPPPTVCRQPPALFVDSVEKYRAPSYRSWLAGAWLLYVDSVEYRASSYRSWMVGAWLLCVDSVEKYRAPSYRSWMAIGYCVLIQENIERRVTGLVVIMCWFSRIKCVCVCVCGGGGGGGESDAGEYRIWFHIPNVFEVFCSQFVCSRELYFDAKSRRMAFWKKCKLVLYINAGSVSRVARTTHRFQAPVTLNHYI